MYKLLILAFFMVSCTRESPAPEKWSEWVSSRKASFAEKISTPAAIQFLYLKEDAPVFYLSNKKETFKLSPSKVESGDNAYKLDFQNQGLLNSRGRKIGDSSAPVKINKQIYLKIVFMPEENKARVFLYDLAKKDLDKKRKRHFFSYKKNGKFEATYSKLNQIKTAKFQRSDGTTRDFKSLGIFTIINGSKFTVYAEPDQKEKAVMLMFRDLTNGESTYGAGRYLYVELSSTPNALKDGDRVVLDFNYSFNPPCAVSRGYHCPLPQDSANFKIEGGEKYLL